MTESGADPVWRRLGAALEQAGAGPGTSGHYPRLATVHPVFIVVEQAGGRWRILGSQESLTPHEARDELAHQFLIRASQAAGRGEQVGYKAAADLLDRERHDELTEHATPAKARASLVRYFREYAPTWEKPDKDTCAAYAEAADALESAQPADVTAVGRRFRVTWVERFVRMDADGPEPPRPPTSTPILRRQHSSAP